MCEIYSSIRCSPLTLDHNPKAYFCYLCCWTLGMTSQLNHGDGFNGDGASKPIHFFRIIHPDTLSQGKLRIPTKFVRKYGKGLSNTMFLKLPNGAEWEVNLEKRDGSVWFHEGWKEFAEYHSLAHGHLLIFRYDGTSQFHLHICGLSTMEIDYPFNKVDRKRAKNSELQPRKRQRTNGNNKDESNSNLQDCKGMLKNPSEEKRNIDQQTKRSFISNCGGHDQAASITSFTVILKPHPYEGGSLNLPRRLLLGYIKPGGQNVTLLVGDRSWRVNMIHYKKNSTTCISAGWPAFVRENNLEGGDACLFELLNGSGDLVMKVSISKRLSHKRALTFT